VAAALLWIVLGIVLVIAEAFTATFVLIMFAGGAFIAALAAAIGLPAVAQVGAFAVASALALWLLRPVIRRHAVPTAVADPDAMDGVKALEGAAGEVLEQVTTQEGLVRVEGELWSARSFDATQVIEPGERIRVIEVRGATVLVWRDEFGDVMEDREANG
jgi:membrane protein implicated in regulation of membrane protease activity